MATEGNPLVFGSPYHVYTAVLAATNTISLAFDAWDAWRWWHGNDMEWPLNRINEPNTTSAAAKRRDD